ncbi:Tetratricopeptide repeat-like superfamily protein [Heracleum sosnowskyi]|uniref:Tetratricopeptide repeat-like superfamily protein n=1 Tax=Heracleum sosnowskyi TaxID=360622 RepID=A0AAD8HK61_9APIA|nr:Tetratricopeptide repeat-like superfamily protein [Heracleum sosnowskyi]
MQGMAEIPYTYPSVTVPLSSATMKQAAIVKQPEVKPKVNYPSYLDARGVSPRARVLCEILANSTLQELDAALNTTGVQPSSELVEEVLKLSYGSPSAAVKFFRWAGLASKHSSFSWNLMVDLLGKNGMFEPMWDAVRSMKQESLLSVATFVSIFGSYCAAGRFSEAVMTFDVMERYGVQPDIVAVNSLLSAICREDNQTVKALEFFEKIKGKIAPDADTFAILLEGWEKEGDVIRAKKTFGEMVIKVGWSQQYMSAYDAFLNTLICGSVADEVITFLQVMKSKTCLPGLKFFTNALDILVKNNDSSHAISLWGIMVGSGLVPNVIMYNAMIGLLCNNDAIADAFRLLDEMVFHGAFPESLTYNMIFQCLIKKKKVPEGGRFFFEMIKNECPPTPSNCADAITMFLHNDDPETGVEIWEYMVKDHILPLDDSSNALLIGLCDLGRLTEMRRFADKILDKRIKIFESTMGKLKVAFNREGRSTRELYEDLERKWKSSLAA